MAIKEATPWWHYFLCVIGGAGGLALILLISWLTRHFVKRKKKQDVADRMENVQLLEEKKLEEQGDEEAFKKEIYDTKTVKVAIICEGNLKSDHLDIFPYKPHTNTENIEEDTAQIIFSEYHTTLGINQNLPGTVSVFKVMVPGATSQIDIKHAQMLLETLSKYKFDLVYLPGIKPPVSVNVMKLIHEIRSKTILVCAAKNGQNEFPGSEVICMGLKDYDSQISTGILDVWIFDEENQTEECIPRAVGFIASIMRIAKDRDENIYHHLCNTENMRKYLIDTSIQGTKAGFGTISLRDVHKEKIEGTLNDISIKDTTASLRKEIVESSQDVGTSASLTDSIVKLKAQDGQDHVITIVVAASPVTNIEESDSVKLIEWKSGDPIEMKENGGKITVHVQSLKDGKNIEGNEKSIGSKFIIYICDILTRLSDKNATVHIISIPTRLKDSEQNTVWKRYGEALEEINSLKPDIVYISAGNKTPESGFEIKRRLTDILDQSIVVTGAKAYKGKAAPLAFPAESVICVGKKGRAYGSVLDFVTTSSESEQQHMKTLQVGKREAWRAAADTVCAAAAVLYKARGMDGSANFYQKLKTTKIMRNILIRMCSNFPVHSYEDGYGVLLPNTVLSVENVFTAFVNKLTDANAPQSYWSGKTIDTVDSLA